MWKRCAPLFTLLAGGLVACSDADTPTQPGRAESKPPVASRLSGDPFSLEGFHFYQPIAEASVAESDRDGSLLDLLAVEICEWNGNACVQPLVARLTSQDDPPGRLTVSDDAIYQALWKTQGDNLDPARDYRIRVLASGGELGHVDVDIVASGRDPATPAGHVRLNAGATLPISFIVEKGTGARVGAAGGDIELANGVRLTVPPGALPKDIFFTAVPATNLPPSDQPIVPGTAWDFGPDGLVFAKPVIVTIVYDPAKVPAGVPQDELRIHKLVNGAYTQQDAGLVDLVNHTVSAEINGFSVYVVMRRNPSNPEDLDPPVIRAFEVRNSTTPTFSSATTLDVSSSDATLITRIRLTDNGSGVAWIDLRWLSPTGRQVRFPCYQGGAPNTGSDTNGEWICSAIFPQHAEAGLWRADVVWIRDKIENQALFVNLAGGFCQTNKPTNCLTSLPQITVNSATPDINPPVLQSLGVSIDVQPRSFGSTLAVDAGTGARRVWFGFPATDNLTGIGGFQPFDYFWLALAGPSNQVLDFIGTCGLTQGTNLNGFWECSVTIPAQAQTGTWRLARLRVPDRAGNGGWSGFSDFLPNATGQLCKTTGNCVTSPTIQVTSTGDGAAPALETLAISSTTGQATTTLGLSDNLSGVSFVRVRYNSVLTTQFQECFPVRTLGTPTSGTWGCTITFSSLAARGQWTLSLELIDVAGNRRFYNRRASDGFLCYLDVSNVQICKDFGTTDLILQ